MDSVLSTVIDILATAAVAAFTMLFYWPAFFSVLLVTLAILKSWQVPTPLTRKKKWLLLTPGVCPLGFLVVGSVFSRSSENGDLAFSIANNICLLMIPLAIYLIVALRPHWPAALAALIWWTYYTIVCWFFTVVTLYGC